MLDMRKSISTHNFPGELPLELLAWLGRRKEEAL